MEKVVYILGAGFSKPLGLPVILNFYQKSKDMYQKDKEKFKHFNAIFEMVDDIAKVIRYIKSDHFNVEEILSILEMQSRLGGKINELDEYKEYISQVIQYFTPDFATKQTLEMWDNLSFDNNDIKSDYIYFVASLFNLATINRTIDNRLFLDTSISNREIKATYTIISLNYDMILEKIASFLTYYFSSKEPIIFNRSEYLESISYICPLAKLHGSVDTKDIIAPTSNKNIEKVFDAWKLAYKALIQAEHIRILGYSLPKGDTSVKYLLKAAISKARFLKTIDVLCLDNEDETVKKEYMDFFEKEKCRFLNIEIEKYLKENSEKCKSNYYHKNDSKYMEFNNLEESHHNFFH